MLTSGGPFPTLELALDEPNTRKSLALHVCCGPDATSAIERLVYQYDVVPFFYNPNIYPEKEYLKRLEESRKACGRWDLILTAGAYETEVWSQKTTGLEEEPEGGKRCRVCYAVRLEKTALFARENGCDFFSTVLTVSPHKDSRLIIALGREVGVRTGVEFLCENFKKKDGFKRSIELSKEMNLYRQNYCGCIHSMKEGVT
ncbi:MAG: epoxyqueuosine reductase QueH [Candidatus Eisenbacteria bacterium]|nr:epoxyqueuosine reductase QueH [Candidatus Eisenbacteria bacterium]